MRFYSICIKTLLLFWLFSSCQKELYFEYNSPATAILVADLSFDCVGDSIKGDYIKDSVLTSENYVDVKLDVSLAGTYIIQSDTVNGFYFKGEGIFSKVGVNTARLYGVGKPINASVTHFKVTCNNSYCEFNINVTNKTNDSLAVFILGGDPNACSGAVLSGTYMQNLPLTSVNTARVNITVQNPGSYTISTPVINGVSFTSTGTLSLGNISMVLQGNGVPLASGAFNYPISFGTTQCSLSVNFSPAAPPAVFTFGGISGNCDAVPLGNYIQNIPTDQTNTLNLSVNVTTLGSYTISTNLVNGISFIGSGVFTTTGIQTVTLFASGTPLTGAPYPFAYTVNNATGCGFSLNVSGDYIICKIDGVFTTFNDSASARITASPAGPMLSIDGRQTSALYPKINIQEIKTSGSIVVDSVNVNTPNITLSSKYYDPTNIDYSALTSTTIQTNPFTLVISSLISTPSRRIKGKFFGVIKNNAGAGPGQKIITEGYYDLQLQ